MDNILTHQLLRLDLSRLSLREKIVIAITLAVAFYFFFYQFLYLSKVKEIGGLKNDILTINKEIAAFDAHLKEAAKRIDDLKMESPEFAAREERKIKGDASKLSSLLEEFTRLARVEKVDFIAIKPSFVEDKGRYLRLELNIDLRSRYQQLGEYIKTLEDLPRGMIINDIRIESNPSISPSVTARVNSVTYIIKE
ncbi:MAG: type 4a pilus biogenesis protein PilO [Nitrospirae bacterium]|nr:type 4a pilus biogenesis protein PilO [Nitrospirota bacterium]